MRLDFSRITESRSFTDLLPSTTQVRKVVRAVPATLAAADGITLITLYVREDWWNFAGVTVLSAVVWIPVGLIKVMQAFSRWEDARGRRHLANRAAAWEERQLVAAHAAAAATMTEFGQPRYSPAAPGRPAGDPRVRAPRVITGTLAPARTVPAVRPAPAAPPPAEPVVLDYEVAPLLPAGAETGWVYDDAEQRRFVVIDSPDGPRLARLADMQLARRVDVTPPLSVSGAVEVTVLPINVDTTHATTGEGIHA